VGAGGVFGQTFDDQTWSVEQLASGSLFSVTCASNLVGWAAGEGGLVVHTEDGGHTWTSQDAHVATTWRAIHFGWKKGIWGAAGQLGVVAGDHGALAASRDGGQSWNVIAPLTDVTLRGAAVATQVGILAVVGDGGTVLRSADEGVTWMRSTIPGAGDLHGVAADIAGDVIVAVDALGGIWSSTDGAVTFLREATFGEALDGVSLTDDGAKALIAGHGGIAASRGAPGTGWTQIATGTTADLHAALITDGGTRFYLAGEAGTLVTSSDGARWSTVALKTSAALYGMDDL
jgi:photosystem II stability/assembly factor-like uncharacterized protein